MPDGATPAISLTGSMTGATGFSLIGDTVPAGIVVTNIDDGRVVYTNRAFSEILGSDASEILGHTWQEYFAEPEDRETLMVRFVEEGVVRNHELRLKAADGRIVWVLASMACVDGVEQDLLMTSFIDVTPLKEAEAEIRKLADQDALTGLPNMRCLRDRLERAVSRAQRYDDRVAVLFIDLDGFKSVNDTHGHDVGDAVLKEVARRLNGVVRHCDTVGRLGGDEFVVMLTDVKQKDDVAIVAHRAVQALAAPIEAGDQQVTVGASIGIASYPENAADSEILLKLADQAMYDVKRNGKNGFRVAA